MSKIDSTTPDLTSYLLEEISAENRDRLDARLLADEGLLEELLVAEEALVDAYIHHDLPAERQRRFEEHFLRSAQRRARVELARSLKERYAPPLAQPSRSWASAWEELCREVQGWVRGPARLAFAGTLMLSLVLGATYLLSKTDTRRVVTLDLVAGVRDAFTPPKISLPLGSEQVKLHLEVESAESYRDFSVRLHSHRGEELLAPHEVRIEVIDPDIITVELVASRLPPSQIELILDGNHCQRGRGKIASYFFEVRR